MTTDRGIRMSALDETPKRPEIKRIRAPGLGQSYPKHYPYPGNGQGAPGPAHAEATLGDPLSIREVASMLGCSPWTVRQQHMPRGLPHFRSGSQGKLVFFRDQVVQWILTQQRKGGCS